MKKKKMLSDTYTAKMPNPFHLAIQQEGVKIVRNRKKFHKADRKKNKIKDHYTRGEDK